MGFYGGVIVDVNAWDFAFNAVVGVDQPESGPVVGVALDVTASQNWPYNGLRSLALFLGLTVRKDLIAPFGCDYEGVVVAGLYAVIDADIPVPQRFPDAFDFSLDALFDGGEDYPGGGAGESAGCALLLNIYAQIVDDITWLGGGDYILFDNMAIIQEIDYIST